MVRIAALLLGLCAAILSLAAPGLPGADHPSASLLAPSSWELARYVPIGLAAVGALFALLMPGLAALLLVGAAAAWAVTGAAGAQSGWVHYLPMGLALLGAFVALVAALFRRARGRRTDNAQIEPTAMDAAEAREREVALSMDPQLVSRSDDTPAPSREIPLTLEDVITPAQDSRRGPLDDVVWADEAPTPRGHDPTVPRRPIFSRPVPVERPRKVEQRPARDNRFIPLLVTLNGIAVIVLAVAVGYLLLQSRADRAPLAAAHASVEAPVAVEAPGDVAGGALASAPAETIAASYTDPFRYCGAIGTIDRADGRYAGPAVTEEIAEAVGAPASASADRVRWRCVEGEVRACSAFGWPACDVTPTAEEMLDYCRRNPTVERLTAPGGTWSCRDGKPVLPEAATWPVDARGYLPSAWVPVHQAGAL